MKRRTTVKCFRRRGPVLGVLVSAIVAAFGAPSPSPAQPLTPDQTAYRSFVREFRSVALRRGIPEALYDRAFRGLTPDPEVIEKNNRQPEFVLPASQYVALVVTDTRVNDGRVKLSEFAADLERIEGRYGVDRHVLAAIWGLETLYGKLRGKRNVIRSLSTLAYKGRRAKFGRNQLLAALDILKAGDITVERMTGSWAGAMGHTQFIPTSYKAYAVDFTGDGRRDIWDNPRDALASAANYLRGNGWVVGRPWGHRVVLPDGFDAGLAGKKGERTIRQWQELGLRRAGGGAFPHPGERAFLDLPAGLQGPAFLLRANFRAIMRYNPAHKYALAIGHLSDRLRGGESALAWPDGVGPIAESERKELQRLLAGRGYDIGEIDGIIGSKTRAAIRDYQAKKGRRADGFPRRKILELLRSDARGGGVRPD
ncbi:MAG: lytic murein transglycosylase [Deltaproteobacteria bacterium]|nr:lytic murein transglycosylase [Deltaproteobacteria bacterium]